MLDKKDRRFADMINAGKGGIILFEFLKHRLFGCGDIPSVLKKYHGRDDCSKFIEEKTLKKVFDAVWESICEKKNRVSCFASNGIFVDIFVKRKIGYPENQLLLLLLIRVSRLLHLLQPHQAYPQHVLVELVGNLVNLDV